MDLEKNFDCQDINIDKVAAIVINNDCRQAKQQLGSRNYKARVLPITMKNESILSA